MVQASTRLGRTCILSEHEADLRIVRRVAVISAVPVRISRSSPLTVARMTKGPWLPCPSAVQGPRGFSTAGAIILCLFLRAIRPLQQCPRLEVGVLNCWGAPRLQFQFADVQGLPHVRQALPRQSWTPSPPPNHRTNRVQGEEMGPAAIPRHQAHPREDASFEPTRLRKVGVREDAGREDAGREDAMS